MTAADLGEVNHLVKKRRQMSETGASAAAVEIGMRTFARAYEAFKFRLRKKDGIFHHLKDYRAPKRKISREDATLVYDHIDGAWHGLLAMIMLDLRNGQESAEDLTGDLFLTKYVELLEEELAWSIADADLGWENMMAAFVAVLAPIFGNPIISRVRSKTVRVWARSLAPQSRITTRFFIVMLMLRTSIGIKLARERVSAVLFTRPAAIPLTVQPCAP